MQCQEKEGNAQVKFLENVFWASSVQCFGRYRSLVSNLSLAERLLICIVEFYFR